jgi:NAD(P)-dependent dehydrogenase (short-subunit alcohol dehydrogenase family)
MYMSARSLQGQRVVIIGGSSGTGLATARAAAAEGAAVTIAARDRERMDAALAILPDGCAGVVVDGRSEADILSLFSQVGDLDHLVYTAGDPMAGRALNELTLGEARQVFEVRYWGAVAAVKYAAPLIRPGGSIVLTSGTIGVRPTPGTAIAASGAGAIEGLTRGLAVELAPVRVNAVRPGVIRTPMWNGVPQPQRTAVFAGLADRTLTKTIGEPDDVAATHLYLMRSRFVTGTVLTVDGGFTLA